MAKVIIAILYIAAILVIGFLAGRNVKTADEFAVANRNIPYWTNVFSMSSAWIGAGSTLGCASMCYAYGVSGFYLAIGVSIGAILASVVFSGKIREENVSTIPELVRKHVGAKCANAIALLSIFSVFSVVASQIRSLGTILQMFVPSLSLLTAIIIMTVVMLIYTVVGGMVAATKTDKLNIGLMVLSVMIILPIVALVKAGGLSNIVETLRTSDPAKLQFSYEDFVFVENLYSSVFVLSADSNLNIQDLAGLKAYVEAGNTVSVAVNGATGSEAFLAAALFGSMGAGDQLKLTPYQSAAEAAQAVAKGETNFAVSHQSQILETFQQGGVTVVCAFDEDAIQSGPFAGVEGVGAAGYPYFRNRCFILARKGTDAAKVAELKNLYDSILADKEVADWLNDTMLLEVDTMTEADVQAHIDNVKSIVNEYKDIVAG